MLVEREAVDRGATQRPDGACAITMSGHRHRTYLGRQGVGTVTHRLPDGHRRGDRHMAAEVHFPFWGEVPDRDHRIAADRAGHERRLAVPDRGGDALHLLGPQ